MIMELGLELYYVFFNIANYFKFMFVLRPYWVI